MSAEELFFSALSSVIGAEIDRSRPRLVYADSYRNTYMEPSIIELLSELRTALGTTNDFSNCHLPIDGLIRNHKKLGTRVVEFDEFQHLTSQRKIAITIAKAYCSLSFHERYLSYCKDPEVIAEVNRVTMRSGFHRPVAGFRYEGGRMSQRAYFDTLKDYVHLSEAGQGFNPIIRFAVRDFDVMTTAAFINLDASFIQERINYMLKNLAD